jgi:Spy/CpxP family protein refolding chaperone
MYRKPLALIVSVAVLGTVSGWAAFASQQGLPSAQYRAAPTTSDAGAQPDGAVPSPAKKQSKNKRLQQMITQLGLTDDQIVKVKAILAEQQSKMRKIKTDASLSPDAKREQYTVVRKESRQELAGVLDREQLKKLRDLRKNHDGTKQPVTASSDATPAP